MVWGRYPDAFNRHRRHFFGRHDLYRLTSSRILGVSAYTHTVKFAGQPEHRHEVPKGSELDEISGAGGHSITGHRTLYQGIFYTEGAEKVGYPLKQSEVDTAV
ncbi:hypothetical protein D3C80_1867630 [compost metagenome]